MPSSVWLQAAAPLLVLVVLRALPKGEAEARHPRLAEAVGVLAALAVGTWNVAQVGGWFLSPAVLTASDFTQYCHAAIDMGRGAVEEVATSRSRFAAWLPGQLVSSVGVLDALWLGSTLPGVLLLHLGTYLWARALHSRAAGIAAVIAIGFVPPVVTMTRTVTFYPALVGCTAMATGLAVAAVRWPRAPFLVGGAVACALLPLLDVRGLLWAPAPLFLLGVGVVRASWRARGVAALALFVAFEGSWYAGQFAYPARAQGMEAQAWFYADEAVRSAGLQAEFTYPPVGGGFVWGRTPIGTLPSTFAALREISEAIPPGVRTARAAMEGRTRNLMPLLPLAAAAGLAAAGALVRAPLRLGALLASMAPYAVMVAQAAAIIAHPRYLGSGLAGLPVLVGVAAAALSGAGEGPRRLPWREAALVGWFLLLGSRLLPPLGTNHFLEVRHLGDEAPASTVLAARSGRLQDGCTRQMIGERRKGGTGDSVLFPTPSAAAPNP